MILVFLLVGWGPLFVDDFVTTIRPELSAGGGPQAFAIGWMLITLYSSLLAGVYIVAHVIRLVALRARQFLQDRRGRSQMR
jgi:hypothetical protein